MQVVILGDLHFGVRKASKSFLEYQDKFFKNILFPYILDHGITKVYQLGDTLDKRQSADFVIASYLQSEYLKWYSDHHVHYYTILGNHDIFYRHSLELSGLSILNQPSEYIHIISEPTIIPDDDIALVPWLCDENKEKFTDFIKELPKRITVLGHFELKGFLVHNGYISTSGSLDTELLKSHLVFSGHYHSPSSKGKIHYIGTPYQLTWADVDDEKAFISYDTKTKAFERILSNHKLYFKIPYEKIEDYDFSGMKNPYIKILLKTKVDEKELVRKLSEIELQCSPNTLQTVDLTDKNITEKETIISSDFKSPFQILNDYISTNTSDNQKDLITKFASELYSKVLEE